LVPPASKKLIVEQLQRSDKHELEEGDRKPGFPASMLDVPESDLNWEQLLAKGGELSLLTDDWVRVGVNAKRFASLMVHLGGWRRRRRRGAGRSVGTRQGRGQGRHGWRARS
jgi:hypothetical protein